MKKIYSLGIMTILVIAMMIGTGMGATTITSTPSGTVAAESVGITSVASTCGSMALIRGTTPTCEDTVTVTANCQWKLTVDDARPMPGLYLDFPVAYKGYMTYMTGSGLGSTIWKKMTYPFLVKGSDALRLGNGVVVEALGQTPVPGPVVVPLSQQVAGDEATGDYSIVITYTIAAR